MIPPVGLRRASLNEVDTLPEQTYFNLLRRFGLVLLIAAVLGAGSGYFLSRFITPTYESSTTLLITQQDGAQGSQARIHGPHHRCCLRTNRSSCTVITASAAVRLMPRGASWMLPA